MPNNFLYSPRLKINHISVWKNMHLFLSVGLLQTILSSEQYWTEEFFKYKILSNPVKNLSEV
jgi:hypothetical protein